MKTLRELIKEKMVAAYPDKMVEVTALELSYVLRNPDVMADIAAEVETTNKKIEQMKKAYDVKRSEPLTLAEAAKPLMSYLAEHHHDDKTIAIVGWGGVEVVRQIDQHME